MYTYCHTLALQDALPISPSRKTRHRNPSHFGSNIQSPVGMPSFGLANIGFSGNATGRSIDPTLRAQGQFLPRCTGGGTDRTDEHTSELQSLMRTPYAAFCLEKKKENRNQPPTTPT